MSLVRNLLSAVVIQPKLASAPKNSTQHIISPLSNDHHNSQSPSMEFFLLHPAGVVQQWLHEQEANDYLVAVWVQPTIANIFQDRFRLLVSSFKVYLDRVCWNIFSLFWKPWFWPKWHAFKYLLFCTFTL